MFINLRNGQLAQISPQDWDFVSAYRWQLFQRTPYKAYAQARIGGRTVLMHRFILMAERGQYVDHCDGDGLNNTRENIRFCTSAQNSMNRRKTTLTKQSGFKGVYRDGSRFRAGIRLDGKTIHLGTHLNELDAALAYNDAAARLFGEFALLNEIK